jgi:hypothetical protein
VNVKVVLRSIYISIPVLKVLQMRLVRATSRQRSLMNMRRERSTLRIEMMHGRHLVIVL